MRLPGDRQTYPSDNMHVMGDIPGLQTNPNPLPDRPIWLGKQHRDCGVAHHTGQEIGRQSALRWIPSQQRIGLCGCRSTLESPGSIGANDAGSSTLSESPCLHPVEEEKSHCRRLKGVVNRFPSAVHGFGTDASNISKREARSQEREDQCGSLHTHIVPQTNNSRKKRTDVQGCIVPHRREVC